MTTQPQGRSMKELREIVAMHEAMRNDLLDAWENLTDDAQVEVLLFARSKVEQEDVEGR